MKRFLPISAVFVLAVSVRLIVLAQISGDVNINHLTGDAKAYADWANTIAAGHWIGSDVFYQAPLYPYFLAILQRLHIHDNAIRFVQALLGSCSCVLLMLAGRRWFGTISGIIAGVMLALYPPAISFDLQIDKPVLDLLLISAFLWCAAGLFDSPTRWRWVGCGALVGLLSLSRENAMVLLFVLIGVAVSARGKKMRPRMIDVAALVAGAAIVLMPVSIRNTILDHEFHLTTAQFGPNFYIGNNADADGVYRPLRPGRGDAQFERADATEIAEQSVGHSLSAGGVSRFWTHCAIADIAANPLHWKNLLRRKIVLTLADTELADSDVHDRFVVLSPVLAALDSTWGFGVLFALSAFATGLAWDQRRRLLLLWIMVAALVLATAMFYVFARYRLVMTPLLMLIAGGGLSKLSVIFGDLKGRFFVGIGCAAFAAAFSFFGDDLIPMRIGGTNDYNRAVIFAQRGDIQAAEASYQRAIDHNRYLAAAYCNLGLLQADQGDLFAAKATLMQAVQLDRNDVPSHLNLGIVLARHKEFSGAIDMFDLALESDPTNTAVRYNRAAVLVVQGRREEAKQALKSLIDSSPNDPFALRASLLLQNLTPATTRSTP